MHILTATAPALLAVTLTGALPAQKKEPFASYTEVVPGTAAKFDMVPIKAGEFVLGSPATEKDRSGASRSRRFGWACAR